MGEYKPGLLSPLTIGKVAQMLLPISSGPQVNQDRADAAWGLASSLYDAFTAPGRALEGKLGDPIQEGNDFALNMMGGGSMVPTEGLAANSARKLAKTLQPEPIRAYRGQKGEMEGDTFTNMIDPVHYGSRLELGPHFGNIDQANAVTGGFVHPEGTLTYPVDLHLKNTIEFPDQTNWSIHDNPNLLKMLKNRGFSDEELAPLRSVYKEVSLAKQEIKDRGWSHHSDDDVFWQELEPEAQKALSDILLAKGYDGIKYKNKYEGKGYSYIPVKRGTVKSAITGETLFANKARGGAAVAAKALTPDQILAQKISQGIEPLRAYHGTKADIKGKMSLKHLGKGEGLGTKTEALWFAEDPAAADSYGVKALNHTPAARKIEKAFTDDLLAESHRIWNEAHKYPDGSPKNKQLMAEYWAQSAKWEHPDTFKNRGEMNYPVDLYLDPKKVWQPKNSLSDARLEKEIAKRDPEAIVFGEGWGDNAGEIAVRKPGTVKSAITGETLFANKARGAGLVVAIKRPDGTVYKGKPGEMHGDIISDAAGGKFDMGLDEFLSAAKEGFVGPDGKFMDRKQAADWLLKNDKATWGELSYPSKLSSEDLHTATGTWK